MYEHVYQDTDQSTAATFFTMWKPVLNAIKLFRLQKNTALLTDNRETKEIKRFMDADLLQNLSAAGWQ